jgi:hypothetical protein
VLATNTLCLTVRKGLRVLSGSHVVVARLSYSAIQIESAALPPASANSTRKIALLTLEILAMRLATGVC